MKKITLICLMLLVVAAGYSQGLTNWKHYYNASPYYNLDMGNSVSTMVPGEAVLIDKTTFSITRIPFPGDIRALNPHLSIYSGYLGYGPNHHLILKGSPTTNTYEFDGLSYIPITSYQGFNINDVTFLPNSGGSTFFTTHNSLHKWDGFTLTNYDSTNSPYHSNGYFNKMTAPNDDIFLSTQFIISIFHGGVWTDYDTTFFNQHYLNVYTYVNSPNNDFAFYNQMDTMIHTYKNATNSWTSTLIPSFVRHASYSAITSAMYDLNGDLWLGGDSIFCKYDGSTFYDYFNSVPPGFANYVYFQNNLTANTFFVAFGNLNGETKQYIYNSSSLTMTAFNDPNSVLPANNMYPSEKDNDGNLWFACDTQNKLIKYDGTWATIDCPSTATSGIWTIKKDTGSSVVFSGRNIFAKGPIQYHDTTFTNLYTAQLYSGDIETIAIDNNHHYWCAGWGGLAELINGVATFHQPPNSSLGFDYPHGLEIDSLNNKWISADSLNNPELGNGVFKFNGTTWTHFTTSNSALPDDSIVQIVREGSTNKIWFCTRNGFARFWNGAWKIYNTSNSPLPSNHAENMYFSSDGTIWFATMQGFATLKAGVWNVYSPFNSLIHDSDVESIVVDDNCTAWIATNGGITSARIENCGSSSSINISGNVNKSNNTPAQNTMVYVYKLNGNGTDVTQVDNVFTDNLGHYDYYTTDTGKYYFQANISTLLYPGEMIAYHDSSLVIQQTQALHLTANGDYTANIKLKQTVSSAGSCTFNGRLSSSTERIGSVRLILMLNGNPVASTLSNVDGSFKFQNLAAVTYTIWVDKLGLNNSIAPSVTIDCANNASAYPLTLYPDHLTMGPVGIASYKEDNTISIFPNPFTEQTTILFSKEVNHCSVKIMDVLGKEIKTINFIGKECVIEKGDMQRGIYFVQITDENKNVVNRKIVIQ